MAFYFKITKFIIIIFLVSCVSLHTRDFLIIKAFHFDKIPHGGTTAGLSYDLVRNKGNKTELKNLSEFNKILINAKKHHHFQSKIPDIEYGGVFYNQDSAHYFIYIPHSSVLIDLTKRINYFIKKEDTASLRIVLENK
jgi:hypothetical protein